MGRKVEKPDDQWRRELSEEAFYITRKKGTEAAFTGKYYQFKRTGTYLCVCCGEALFSSAHKYESGSGWPSFWQPITDNALESHKDVSHGMIREEIVCQSCGAHLGHVFPDGPQPTGQRYCINSAALTFKEPEP